MVQRFSKLPRSLTQSAEFNARALQRHLERISGIGEISSLGKVSDLGDTASDYGSVHELARTASDHGEISDESHVDTRELDVRRGAQRFADPSEAEGASLNMFESDEGELTPVVEAASSIGMVLDSLGDDSDMAFESSGDAPALSAPSTESAHAPLPQAGLETRLEAILQRVFRIWTGDGMWFLLGLGALALGPLLIATASDYYLIWTDGIPGIRPSVRRPGHPWEKLLRPGGRMGLWFGIIGSGLFLLNLTYVLRRRLGVLSKFIGLRTWLNVHAVTGLLGASLILVHTSLLFNNIPAVISFTGIAVAVVSGMFGRYVLLHLPRFVDESGGDGASTRARELAERQDAAERLGELRRQLRIALADHPKLRDAAVEALAANKLETPRGFRYLGRLFVGDWLSMARNRKLASELKRLLISTKGKEARQALLDTLALVKNQSLLERRLAQAPAVRDLMDTWRGLHFILALVAIMFMVLHILLALPFTRLSETFGG